MDTNRKARILVVEDDHLFLWSLVQFLKREGYEVVAAEAVEPALDIAREEPFDFIISDFNLPDLNGKELIKRMRAANPTIKTVLISAYQKEETGGDDAFVVDAYLNKPIELANLKRLLEGLVTKSVPSEVLHLGSEPHRVPH